jgi:hypothetical protein
MKRPEASQVNDSALQLDAWKRPLPRGLHFFLTCSFREVVVWETAKGANQLTLVLIYELAPGLTQSSYALVRRNEQTDN